VTTSFEIGLFLHICFLLIGTSAGVIMVLCSTKLRAARTGAEAFPWGMLASKTALAFPVAIVGLFLTGAYLTNTHDWSWSTGWIDAAIAGLVVLFLEGALINGRHGKELGAALKANGPGPIGDEVRALTMSRLAWATTVAPLGLVLAIVWNMLHKPGLGTAIVGMVVGYGVGAGIGLFLQSRPVKAPAAAGAPAH
jgi:uncharacterized membrane protein